MIERGKLVGGAGIPLIALGVSLSFGGNLNGGLVVVGVGVLLLWAGVIMVSRKKKEEDPHFDRDKLQFNDGPVPETDGLFEVDGSHSIKVGNVTGARKGNKILSSLNSYDIEIGEVRFREDGDADDGTKRS